MLRLFLSCLYGSQLARAHDFPDVWFLSCLYGSQQDGSSE